MEKKRKIVVALFIVLLAVQISLLGFISDRNTRAKIHNEELKIEIERASNIGLDIIQRAQSNELHYLTEMWHNWNWDFSAGDWENIFTRFIERAIVSRQGSDGQRITLVFNSDGDCVYTGAGAELYATDVLPYVFEDTNVLYPNVIKLNGIHWNKVVIPTPTSSTPRIVVFYGFDELNLLALSHHHLAMVNYHGERIHRNGNYLLWITGVIMIVLFVLGMAISFSLRVVEYETQKEKIVGGRRKIDPES